MAVVEPLLDREKARSNRFGDLEQRGGGSAVTACPGPLLSVLIPSNSVRRSQHHSLQKSEEMGNLQINVWRRICEVNG
jgi:hypothetical protein